MKSASVTSRRQRGRARARTWNQRRGRFENVVAATVLARVFAATLECVCRPCACGDSSHIAIPRLAVHRWKSHASRSESCFSRSWTPSPRTSRAGPCGELLGCEIHSRVSEHKFVLPVCVLNCFMALSGRPGILAAPELCLRDLLAEILGGTPWALTARDLGGIAKAAAIRASESSRYSAKMGVGWAQDCAN